MALEIRIQSFGDLTESEREGASNNGSGKEYANYLRVTHNGRLVLLESDAMEPEDCRFSRDLSWVAKAISEAYALGLADSAREQP